MHLARRQRSLKSRRRRQWNPVTGESVSAQHTVLCPPAHTKLTWPPTEHCQKQ